MTAALSAKEVRPTKSITLDNAGSLYWSALQVFLFLLVLFAFLVLLVFLVYIEYREY
jgi:hypothetical protein